MAVADLLEGAALVDLRSDETLEVTGADRVSWLHGLCTQHIKGLASGQGAYACHLDVKARIIADMRVMVFPDRFWLCADDGVGKTLRRALRKYVVMEDVKVRSVTASLAPLGVFGPHAADMLIAAGASTDIRALAPHHWLFDEGLPVEAIVVADDRLGVPGYRLMLDPEDFDAVASELDTAWATAEECEVVRVRHGRPRLPSDLDGGVLFNESGLDSAIHYQKGCYLGQEVVERVHSRGRVSRRLLPLRVTATDAPPVGAVITGARKYGALTSVAVQPDGWTAALGYVHRSWEPGTPVTIEHEGRSWPAEVLAD